MKVLRHGLRVKTIIGEIEGLIVEISILPNHVVYKISYFSSGIHTNAWLYDFEIEVCAKRKAGFGHQIDEENNEITLKLE